MRLSAQHTIPGGHRSFDILHVAAALELGAKEFLTFDARQSALAEAENLTVKPQRPGGCGLTAQRKNFRTISRGVAMIGAVTSKSPQEQREAREIDSAQVRIAAQQHPAFEQGRFADALRQLVRAARASS